MMRGETPAERPRDDLGVADAMEALSTGEFSFCAEDNGAWSSKSFLAPEVEEGLVETNPRLLTWFRSASGFLFQVTLLVLFVVLDTSGGILNAHVLNASSPDVKPLASSMIVMTSALSMLIGSALTVLKIAFSKERPPLCRVLYQAYVALMDWPVILNCCAAAALFNTGSIFTMVSYSKLDPGMKRILDQLRLPFTAALSSVVVGRKYSMQEWCTLVIILLAVIGFFSMKVQHDEITELHANCLYPAHCFDSAPVYDICAIHVDGRTVVGTAVGGNNTAHEIRTFPIKAGRTNQSGLFLSLMATLCNCLGSLISERIMKKTASTFYPTHRAHMEATGLPVAVAMSFLVPLYIESNAGKGIWWMKTDVVGSGEGLFQGYTPMTFVAISVDVALSWLGGIIVKKFSAVVKMISKCFVLVLTVLVSSTLMKPCYADPLPVSMYALAFIITFDTSLFAGLPKDKAGNLAPADPKLPAREGLIAAQNGGIELRTPTMV